MQLTNEQLKEMATSMVGEAIDNLFIEIHNKGGTKSGDITPEQQLLLDLIQEKLSELIFQQVLQNL